MIKPLIFKNSLEVLFVMSAKIGANQNIKEFIELTKDVVHYKHTSVLECKSWININLIRVWRKQEKQWKWKQIVWYYGGRDKGLIMLYLLIWTAREYSTFHNFDIQNFYLSIFLSWQKSSK